LLRVFGHHIPRSLLLLLVLETLTLVGSFVFAHAWFAGYDGLAKALSENAWLPIAVLLVTMQIAGLHDDHALEGMLGMVLRLALAFGVGVVTLALLAAGGISPRADGPWLLTGVALALSLIMVERLCLFRWMLAERFRRRVLVLGSGPRAREIEQLIHRSGSGKRFHLVGYLADSAQPGTDMSTVSPVWSMPGEDELLDFARRHRVQEIVVAVRDRRGKLPIEQLLECKLNGIRVCDMSTFMEREGGQIRLESLNASWLVFHDGFLRSGFGSFLKRVVDIAASLLLLIPGLPLMALAAFAITLEDGGPIFYRQTRVGQNGRVFRLTKLRSMRVDAEAGGARWATRNDQRVTHVGKVLRKTRIDELPQVVSVLLGHMSFVGPRPERPEFVAQLARQIPYFSARHSVKPGITGWAQVRFPYGASVHDSRCKLEYDLYYIKNYSIFLDVLILLHTVRVVLFARGAR
jgi:sugar transferase (PEP-CTERM system associated)